MKYIIKNQLSIYLLLLTTLLSSCLDEVSQDVLTGEPTVIINGLITNEEGPFYVRVTMSSNVLSDFNTNNRNGAGSFKQVDGEFIFPPVKDATVTLSDDEGNIDVLELSDREYGNAALADKWGDLGFYQTTTDIKGVPGRTYTLKVLVDGKEYSSSVKMLPPPPEINEITITEKILTSGQPHPYEIPVISFDEPQDEENFYMFKYWDFDNGDIRFPVNLHALIFDDVIILDDEFLKPKVENLSLDLGLVEGQGLDPIFGDLLEVYIYSLDKDVYSYFESLQFQLRNDGGVYSPAPSSPPTNISNGGLGIFMASSISKKTVQVR